MVMLDRQTIIHPGINLDMIFKTEGGALGSRGIKTTSPFQSKGVFDLRGGSHGFCILKIKSLLKSLNPGETIEVLVTGPSMIDDLAAVLAAGPDRLVNTTEENGFSRICLRKN